MAKFFSIQRQQKQRTHTHKNDLYVLVCWKKIKKKTKFQDNFILISRLSSPIWGQNSHKSHVMKGLPNESDFVKFIDKALIMVNFFLSFLRFCVCCHCPKSATNRINRNKMRLQSFNLFYSFPYVLLSMRGFFVVVIVSLKLCNLLC